MSYPRKTKGELIADQMLASVRAGEEARLDRLADALAVAFGLEVLAPGDTPERRTLRDVGAALWRSFPRAGEAALTEAILSLQDLREDRRKHMQSPWTAFWLVSQRLGAGRRAAPDARTPEQAAWLKMRGTDG